MTMDLGQLFDDKQKAPKFDVLKVYHKESGEVRFIKSTRFNPQFHSINIPQGAKENLDLNHPDKAIELQLSDFAPAPQVSTELPIIEVKEPVETFLCSKGCGKVCTSNAGRAAHERACKFVTQ